MMDYAELRNRLLSLPDASPQWLSYVLAYPADGRPIPVGYCLIRQADKTFLVYQGDDRGSVSPAVGEDGKVLVFPTESDACEWIWETVLWMQENGL
ncbi:hypothetical protein ACFVU2_20655 [Leifsonia sp. NPDC058194]|uniref:hypothetical protein n=1 Tax=Leifsonia sp. NPDC058194 TaxID=3346374 RepID=UPI0036DC746E